MSDLSPPIRLAGGSVWTGEGTAPTRLDLLVEGTAIRAFLPPGDAGNDAWQIVDATDCMILPPFFNGHVHAGSALSRGTENSLPLELWSFWAIAFGSGMTEAHHATALKLTAVEMIRGGIGGYIDHAPQIRFAPVAVDVHRASGLRVAYAPFFADLWDEDILDIPADRRILKRIGLPVASTPEGISIRFTELAETLRGDRVQLLLGPNAPQRCSDDLLDEWARVKDRLGLASHTHLLETLPQALLAGERWPDGGIIGALKTRGLLDRGLSVGHAIWLDDCDYDELAAADVTAIHNPLSNLMLGSGRMRLRAALSAGLRVGLGTDCANTAGRYDLFETMRHALVAGRDPGSDFTAWITAEEVLTAAASAGWSALSPASRPKELEKDGPADLQVIDLKSPGLAGVAPSVRGLVCHADVAAVRDLMIDGVWLMRDRRIEIFDEAEVLAEAHEAAMDIRASAEDGIGSLGAIVPDYLDWQRRRFSSACCPRCGTIHPPARGEQG